MGRQRLNPALQYGRRHDHRQEAEDIPPVGPDPAFVMLVKTDNAGTSGTNQMQLTGAAGTYTVDWGDGVVETLTGVQTHTYPAPGEYVIRITGGLTAIRFANGGDKLKLLDIQNWGDIAWTTMAQAFWGCHDMISTATDAPDLSGVTDISLIFRDARVFNSNLNGWNVENVVNMSTSFNGARLFNNDISGWNVGNVTNFSGTFGNAWAFNQDISGWDTSKVTNMSTMFVGTVFDQDISGWNVANVTTMSNMFLTVTLSSANYGALLIGWAAQTLKSGVSFNGGGSKYPTDGTGNPATDAAAARAKIIADFGWTISDGGPE